MPGRFFLDETTDVLADLLSARPDADVMPTPRRNIAPGQQIAVLTPDRQLTLMRWGIIPVGRKNARGRPVMETLINVRGETVFEKSAVRGLGRAIVPASGWYEWTGKTGRKTAWRITPRAGGVLLFAAVFDVWTAPGGKAIPQVATVTCPPSADVREIHDRMGVILSPDRAASWLEGAEAEARDMISPVPTGTLNVAEAIGVDWAGP